MVKGKVPVAHAFMDGHGRRKIVNGDCYFNILQENIWPTFRENVLYSVALNVLKRANLCMQQNLGHFQHLL